MLFERIPLQFDVQRLQEHIHQHVLPLPPAMMPANYGGWSILSSDGTYTDGWVTSGMKVDASQLKGDREEVKKWFKSIGLKAIPEYQEKTPLCIGYMDEVISRVREFGVKPCRARVIRMVGKGSTTWHRDNPEEFPAYRLHLPIITNENCFFEYEDSRHHMAADGSVYVVQVNKVHRAINYGNTDRFHLVMDIYNPEKLPPNNVVK